ncbi:MAG: hypothetical protein GY870_08945 [archaeon]|nr:hypothetical protein [archaeon]
MSLEPKPLTDKEKKLKIKELKAKIDKFTQSIDENPIQIDNLARLHISLAYYLAEFPENYNDSINEFLKAQDLIMQLDDKLKLASLKGAIASVCYAKKDFTNSVQFYKDSLELLKNSKSTKEIMIGKKGLGLSLLGINEEEKGIKILLEAADLCVNLSDTSNYMEIISILKIYYSKEEEWEIIIELEKKALKILENLDNKTEVTYSQIEIGLCLSKLKKNSEALDYFKKSVNSALGAENNNLIYSGIILVAESHFHMKEIEKAKKEYLKALSLISYMGNKEEMNKTIMVLMTLGVDKKEIDTEIEKGKKEKNRPKSIKT